MLICDEIRPPNTTKKCGLSSTTHAILNPDFEMAKDPVTISQQEMSGTPQKVAMAISPVKKADNRMGTEHAPALFPVSAISKTGGSHYPRQSTFLSYRHFKRKSKKKCDFGDERPACDLPRGPCSSLLHICTAQGRIAAAKRIEQVR
jgi:hypothetical protein